jgi:hypothetical protein
VLTLLLLCQRQPFNGKVIAFRATASENYLLGTGSDKLGYLGSGGVHSFPGGISPIVKAGWIAKGIPHIGQHRLANLGEKGSGGSMVQIYLPHLYTSQIMLDGKL